MPRFNWLSRKSLPIPGVMQTFILENSSSTLARNVQAFAREGYGENPIAFFCINTLARAAASVALEVWQYDAQGNRKVVNTHKALGLLTRPNPTQSWDDFVAEMVSWHRIAGECFVLRLPEKGPPSELYLLDPSGVEIEKDKGGSLVPLAFTYGKNDAKRRYPVNPVTGACQVLQIKTFNPLDPFRGLSPLSPAARDVDNHNAGNKWNSSLLTNSARPSGIIEVAGTPNETTLDQARQYFMKVWQGARNVGKVPILTGGMKFTPMSLNPKDMEFGKGMSEAAKNIALVYGVPLPLVTTDAATFSNMESAQERLWTDTVLPLLDTLIGALGNFVLPLYGTGKNEVLGYNAESVPALEPRRERLYKRMVLAVGGGIVTPDEARAEMGFPEMGGDATQLRKPMGLPAANSNNNTDAGLVKAMRDAGYTAEEAVAVLKLENKAS